MYKNIYILPIKSVLAFAHLYLIIHFYGKALARIAQFCRYLHCYYMLKKTLKENKFSAPLCSTHVLDALEKVHLLKEEGIY